MNIENKTNPNEIDLPEKFEADTARLIKLAMQGLERVLTNPKAPAAATVSAANSVLDRAERAVERRRRPEDKQLSELTLAELDELIRRTGLARAATNAEDAQIVGERAQLPVSNQ